MFFCKTLPLRDLSSLVLFIFLNKISVSYKKKKRKNGDFVPWSTYAVTWKKLDKMLFIQNFLTFLLLYLLVCWGWG